MFVWHFGEFFFCSLLSESYFFIFHKNCQEWQKMFLIKIDFWKRNLIFESLRGSKNTKNSTVNNNTLTNRSQNPKTYWPFLNFIAPVRTIWHAPWIELDLSCSEHFFWLPGGSYNVPNGLISIFPFSPFFRFWHFSWFSLKFNFFQSFFRHFLIFFA